MHLLLEQVGPKRGVVRPRKVAAQSARVCVRLVSNHFCRPERGSCHYCQIKKKQLMHYTSFGCTVCRVRLQTVQPASSAKVGHYDFCKK